MLFYQLLKQRSIVRGPDCGCGGTCSFCAPMLERLRGDHAHTIEEATRCLELKKDEGMISGASDDDPIGLPG